MRPLEPTAAKIDPDVNVLVLVHPKELAPATQFAIDQYALRGGHVLVFVDPLAEADIAGADPQQPDGGDGGGQAPRISERCSPPGAWSSTRHRWWPIAATRCR